MSWDKYRKSRVHRLDLAEIGLEGFWIEVRKLGSFSLSEAAGFEKIGGKESSLEDLEFAMAHLIVNWNLTDPDGNGDTVLPLPSQDKEVLKKLPVEVMTHINVRVGALEGQPPLGEEKGTTSGPTSEEP